MVPSEAIKSTSDTLAFRFFILVGVVGMEAILASMWLDGATLSSKNGFALGLVRDHAAFAARVCIGFAAIFAAFAYLSHQQALAALSTALRNTSIQRGLLAAHVVFMAAFSMLSASLYGSLVAPLHDNALAVCWIATAVVSVVSIAFAVVPWHLWMELLRATRLLWAFAAAASYVACSIGTMSWRFWEPTSRITFWLVNLILAPFVTSMVVQPVAMRIGTNRFTAVISPQCSGLEGVVLVLIFGLVWLILFRQELRFPQAFLMLPAGMAVLFLLNAFRIAALILIGNAGARDIAAKGFHSQAGWIAFNLVALGFSVVARRARWFSLGPGAPVSGESCFPEPADEYPAAPFLIPLLAIFAAGMLSGAMTAAFEWTYFLRTIAAAAALGVFWKRYSEIDWHFGWAGPMVGVAAFVIWIGFDSLVAHPNAQNGVPLALAEAPETTRVAWILCRIVTAVLLVPIAEELAFRGFLLRRLVSPDFEQVSFRAGTVVAVGASSLIFGLMHGRRWVEATITGILYAHAMRRRGRLGDSIAAHATTNAMLAAYVLFFQKWSLW